MRTASKCTRHGRRQLMSPDRSTSETALKRSLPSGADILLQKKSKYNDQSAISRLEKMEKIGIFSCQKWARDPCPLGTLSPDGHTMIDHNKNNPDDYWHRPTWPGLTVGSQGSSHKCCEVLSKIKLFQTTSTELSKKS